MRHVSAPLSVGCALLALALTAKTIAAQPASKADDQGAILAALRAIRLDSLCGARPSQPAPCGTVVVDTTVHFALGEWGRSSAEPSDSVVGSLPATVFPIRGNHNVRYGASGADWHHETFHLKVGVAEDTAASGRILVAIDIEPRSHLLGTSASVSLSRAAGTWRVDRIWYWEE